MDSTSFNMDPQNIAWAIAALIVALVLTGALEETLDRLIGRVVNLVAGPLSVLGSHILATQTTLRAAVREGGEALNELDTPATGGPQPAAIDTRDPVWLWHRMTWILGSFALACIFIASDVPITYLVVSTLYGLDADQVADLMWFVAIAWVATATFWGATLLSSYALLGRPELPWTNLPELQLKRARQWFWTALGLTLLTGGILGAWKYLLANGTDAPWLGLIAMVLMSLLLLAAAAVSGWSLFPGLGALIVLGQVLAQGALHGFHLVLELVVALLGAFNRALCALVALPGTLGRRIWNFLIALPGIGGLPLRALDEPPGPSQVGTTIGTPVDHPHMPLDDGLREPSLPSLGKIVRELVFLALDRVSDTQLQRVRTEADRVGTATEILVQGSVEPQPTGFIELHGVKHVGPVRTLPLGRLAPRADELVPSVVERTAAAILLAGATRGVVVTLVDLLNPAWPELEQALRHMSGCFPDQALLIIMQVPELVRLDLRVLPGLQALGRLVVEGAVRQVLWTDATSPLAHSVGAELQDAGVATMLASVAGAAADYPRNRSFKEIVTDGGQQAPSHALALAAVPIQNSQQQTWLGVPLSRHIRFDALLDATQQAVDTALNDPSKRTTHETRNPARPSTVVVTAPIERAQLERFTTEIRRRLLQVEPAADLVVKVGTGPLAHGNAAPLTVQAAVLYPIASVPAVLEALVHQVAASVTAQPVASNGAASREEARDALVSSPSA